jgi:hypothetical protein
MGNVSKQSREAKVGKLVKDSKLDASKNGTKENNSSKKSKSSLSHQITDFAETNSDAKADIETGHVSLGDGFYRVSINSIVVENISPDESDTLKFYNPRVIDAKDMEVEGLSEDEISIIKESIRSNGLMTPLIGRFKTVECNGASKTVVSIINGHRRYQAIKQLVDQNIPCYDPKTKQTVPASELYSSVHFKIFDVLDDMECYLLSFEEDKTKVKFNSGTEARFVQHCRSKFIPEAEILRMTGNSSVWLQDTFNLLDSLANDAEVLAAFFSGRIDRGLAKHLSSIEDIDTRHRLMSDAIETAIGRFEAKKEKVNATVNSKLNKIEVLAAEKIVHAHGGNHELVDEKQAQIEELEGEVKQVITKSRGAAPRAGKSDLNKAITRKGQQTDEEHVASNGRISAKWPEFYKSIISNGGALPDEDSVLVPDVLARYSIALLKAVEKTQSSPADFIKEWLGKFTQGGLKND